MKQKRHTPEEFIRLLRECDSSPLSQGKSFQKTQISVPITKTQWKIPARNLICCHAATTLQGGPISIYATPKNTHIWGLLTFTFISSRGKNFLYPSLYMITKHLWKSQMLSHPNSELKSGIFSSWLFCYLSIQPSVIKTVSPYGIEVLRKILVIRRTLWKMADLDQKVNRR